MANNGYCRERQMTSGLVYQHMSSHYRRILNAKPAVDTSTPESFKSRIARQAPHRRYLGSCANTRSISRDVPQPHTKQYQFLIDRIVSNNTCNPTEVCRRSWPVNPKKDFNDQQQNTPYRRSKQNLFIPINEEDISSTALRSLQKDRKRDLLDLHEGRFKSFCPRILKTEANSKLREMRVYHPPRRKQKGTWTLKGEKDGQRQCTCLEECVCGVSNNMSIVNEQSQTSSRDSAYNGGNSSTPDTRSPTPLQRHHHAATQTEQASSQPSRPVPHKLVKLDDDLEYTKFIHNITAEAVNRGHFTDKSLSRVIEKHVCANLHRLNKERMLGEVSKLRSKLGMRVSDVDNIPLTVPARTTDTFNMEFDSWTSYYLKLMDSTVQRKTSDSIGIAISDKLSVLAISENEETDSDHEVDSDSSRETTIKEVAQYTAAINSDLEDDVVESLDISLDENSDATG